jgi:predicted RNase H-like nuclease (RuvC/YqgF family)
VEVPVEKIVYIYDKKEGEVEPIIVEKIVEVIKEATIEPNNDKLLMLQETLNKLRKELTDKNSKITELEGTIKNLEQTNINQGAAYMKGSNLTNNI